MLQTRDDNDSMNMNMNMNTNMIFCAELRCNAAPVVGVNGLPEAFSAKMSTLCLSEVSRGQRLHHENRESHKERTCSPQLLQPHQLKHDQGSARSFRVCAGFYTSTTSTSPTMTAILGLANKARFGASIQVR